jgi:hypothetical protein
MVSHPGPIAATPFEQTLPFQTEAAAAIACAALCCYKQPKGMSSHGKIQT